MKAMPAPPMLPFARALEAAFGATAPRALGLAVSGGGDSLALALLAADWARARGIALHAITIDHGLRSEAAAEAAHAARVCAGLGITHDLRHWPGQGARGNLLAAARQARYGLIADWARGKGLAAVLLGHTRDDQAETVLMRLARGAGVDGLSAMDPQRRAQGLLWLRPLLEVARADLRALLEAKGIGWCEDPTNADTRFARVRVRRAFETLAPLGIDAEALSALAARMASARLVLEDAAVEAARDAAVLDRGDVLIDRGKLGLMRAETRARLLGAVLRWIGNADYAPRRAALDRLAARIAAGDGATLGGCRLTQAGGFVRASREWRAVRGLAAAPHMLWDGRWQMLPPEGCETAGLHVAPLGQEGLSACADWRETGLPRATLVASPAVWQKDRLVAAPLAGMARGWEARTVPGPDDLAPLLRRN